jgi:hypothetical protein
MGLADGDGLVTATLADGGAAGEVGAVAEGEVVGVAADEQAASARRAAARRAAPIDRGIDGRASDTRPLDGR